MIFGLGAYILMKNRMNLIISYLPKMNALRSVKTSNELKKYLYFQFVFLIKSFIWHHILREPY